MAKLAVALQMIVAIEVTGCISLVLGHRLQVHRLDALQIVLTGCDAAYCSVHIVSIKVFARSNHQSNAKMWTLALHGPPLRISQLCHIPCITSRDASISTCFVALGKSPPGHQGRMSISCTDVVNAGASM